MSQTITVKIKLLPTKEQASILREMSQTPSIRLFLKWLLKRKVQGNQAKIFLLLCQVQSKTKQSRTQKAYSKKQRKTNSLSFLCLRNLSVFGTIKTILLISHIFRCRS